MHYGCGMARPLSFRWDEDFIDRIDKARGITPRSTFVRAAVERVLNEIEQGGAASKRAASQVEKGR